MTLGAQIADRITQDPLWPTLVARVDTAAATGLDPARLVRDAAALLAATAHTAGPDKYATVLLLHISTLADPAPVTPGDGIDHDGPPDPADADLQPPDDLHTAPGHEQALVPAGGDGDGANDIAELGDPGDEEALPADPAADPAAAADETIDEHAALDRAAAATDAAWEYFQTRAPRSWVPGYLADRRLDTMVAGCAASGDRLIRHLHRLGYTDQELRAAGLAKTSTRTGRLASRFRNRLMLPIHDTSGRVVAFIGRTHPDQAGDAPNCLNTPTTDLFRKHDLPHGLTAKASRPQAQAGRGWLSQTTWSSATLREAAEELFLEVIELERLDLGGVTGCGQLGHHVVDRGLVTGPTGGTIAAVCVRDGLQRSEVCVRAPPTVTALVSLATELLLGAAAAGDAVTRARATLLISVTSTVRLLIPSKLSRPEPRTRRSTA